MTQNPIHQEIIGEPSTTAALGCPIKCYLQEIDPEFFFILFSGYLSLSR
jgi:hypothetical protein